MEISEIRKALELGLVRITDHADEEAEADGLSFDEIYFSVLYGEIIEDYPNDRPYPSCLILGFTFAYLITGAVLTETIFSWPGIGSYAVDAARNLDYPAIMGVTIVGGMAFLLSNLVTDIAYAFADPRIRLG